ncbi:MAG: hypothetical protein WB624_18460, partial [Xanthobacteraceae bacterium]|jgi:hypothetical protein
MATQPTTGHDSDALAASGDIKRLFGALDDAKLIDILALRPTVLDIEEASLWLAGDTDIFGAGRPLRPVAGEIVAILTADEEEEPSQAS